MNIYDLILEKIRKIRGKEEREPITNISASSSLAAEIGIISSFLLTIIMLRLLNEALMVILVLLVFVIAIFSVPLMPKLKKEQSDSLNVMIFYVILALGIIVTMFYWRI